MRSGEAVSRPQSDDGSDGAALLPDACVCGAVDQVLRRQLEDRFLEGADQMQLHKHPDEEVRFGFLPVLLRRGELNPRDSGL
jgi:hypothetical protein